MSGKINLPHTCPKCGTVVKTYVGAQLKFGFRQMAEADKNGKAIIRIQSHCKKCRSK